MWVYLKTRRAKFCFLNVQNSWPVVFLPFFLMKTLKHIPYLYCFLNVLYKRIVYINVIQCVQKVWKLCTCRVSSRQGLRARYKHTVGAQVGLPLSVMVRYTFTIRTAAGAVYTLYARYYNICNAPRVEIIELVLENEF